MKLRKMAAATLAAVLMAGLFAGCGSAQETSSEDSAASVTSDTVVATAAGKDITWGEVCYWMYYQMSDYYNSHGATPNLSVEISTGYTYGDYMLSQAIDDMVRYVAIEKYAEDNGIALVDADQAGVDNYINTMIQKYGSEDAYNQALAKMGSTADDIRRIEELVFLSQRVYKTLYGAEGSQLSDDTVAVYADKNGFVMAKSILVLKTDSSGNALDDTALAAAKAKIDNDYAQLAAWSDGDTGDYATVEALFDDLMNTDSEDTELQYFPNGYLFTTGDMQDAVYNAVTALDIGTYSAVVETDTCYAILLRLPLDYTATPYSYKSYADYGYSYSFRQYVSSVMFEDQVTGWITDANVQKMPVVSTIDAASYFSN